MLQIFLPEQQTKITCPLIILYYRYNNVHIMIIMIGQNFPSIENFKSHTPHMLMRLVVSSRLFVSGAIEALRCRGVFGDPRSSEC